MYNNIEGVPLSPLKMNTWNLEMLTPFNLSLSMYEFLHMEMKLLLMGVFFN